jgi:hypothetical protein
MIRERHVDPTRVLTSWAIAVVAVVLPLVTACGSSDGGQTSTGDRGGSQRADATASADAAVYSAVVRQLVLEDHGYGGVASPYRVVYVLDGAAPGADNPTAPLVESPTTRFAPPVKRMMRRHLRGLHVVFVARRGSVVTGRAPGHVIRRGVLITLGPIQWRGARRAVVASSRWANGLNGQWAAYRVTRKGSAWRVAGFAGNTIVIS